MSSLKVAKAVSHSLNNCVNCLPGQKDVDMALKSIGESSKKLLVDSVSFFVALLLTDKIVKILDQCDIVLFCSTLPLHSIIVSLACNLLYVLCRGFWL